MEQTVLSTTREGYRVIILNRPQRLNALDEAAHRALADAVAAAASDATCRALLITGAGRAFCAGQDLTERRVAPGEKPVPGTALERYYNPLIRRLRSLPMPVVAAVNGIAAGAGVNIALACDIVLAARGASFVQAFARIGLAPDAGGSWFLPRLIGPARARALCMLAQPLSAERAEQWGLIWKVIDDDQLMPEAEKMCEHFAGAATVGLALTKRALDAAYSNDLSTQLDLERDFQREASATEDYAEGVRAFFEKRPARFQGR